MEDYGVFWVVNVQALTTSPVPVAPTSAPTIRPLPTASTPTVGASYSGTRVPNFVSKNIDRGRFLLLGDRSLWEVARIDRIESRLWLAYTDVLVVPSRFGLTPFVYTIVEIPVFGTGSSVEARWLRAPPLSLSAKSDDGSLVRLSDGSAWRLDPFENAMFWFEGETIYAVDDREGIYGYRLVNRDQRTSAGAEYLGSR